MWAYGSRKWMGMERCVVYVCVCASTCTLTGANANAQCRPMSFGGYDSGAEAAMRMLQPPMKVVLVLLTLSHPPRPLFTTPTPTQYLDTRVVDFLYIWRVEPLA